MAPRSSSCFGIFLRKSKEPRLSIPVEVKSDGGALQSPPELGPNVDGIKILSSEISGVTPLVDIVAIHGLNGHAEGTWTDFTTNAFWLKDFLTQDIEASRVMTFGYDSKVFSKSVSEIRDFGLKLLNELRKHRDSETEKRRPIIFICHSLGGIVCKQALILARERSNLYQETLSSTYGIIFMGTPHRGSGLANLGGILGALEGVVNLGGFGKSVRKGLVKDLKKNSKALTDISRSFIERGAYLRIVSFYEQLCLHGMTVLVVDEDSATLGINNEVPLPINADHRNMCKFGDRNNNYNSVLNELQRMCREAIGQQETENVSEGIARQQRDESQEKILAELEGAVPEVANLDESDSDEFTEHSPGTCEWILQNPNYKSWDESASSAGLWLSGGPGTGKTVMSKFIIETLKETKIQYHNPVYAYVFCHQQRTANLSALLQSILYQVLVQDSSLFKYISYDVKEIKRSIQGMLKVLKNMMLAMKETLFLIFDGVDELGEARRARLLEGLSFLMIAARSKTPKFGETGAGLKILISSRPHRDIEDSIRVIPEMRHLLLYDNEGHVNADIRKFASDSMNKFIRKNELDITLEEKMEIENALVEGAKGMFLWASLAWSTFVRPDHHSGEQQTKFESRWNPDELGIDGMRRKLELLKKLPKNLSELYEKMLRDIPGGCVNDAKTVFRCLLAAYRPLKVTELTIILNMKSHGQWLSSSKEVLKNAQKIRWKERIKLSCGLLISIKTDGTVRLLHHTVREFLTLQTSAEGCILTHPPMSIPEWKFGLEEVHSHIGTLCLTYLSFEEFAIGPLKAKINDELEADFQLECEEGFRARIAEFQLLEYASRYWSDHIHRTAKTGEILQRFVQFTVSGLGVNLAFQVFWFSKGCGGSFPSKMTPLHIICYHGLDTLIGEVTLDDLHKIDIYGRKPLHWAIINGHLVTVQKLLTLSGDFDPNSLETATSSPLHFAADRGHTELAKLFLEKGMSPDAIDEEFGTPLQAAAYNGHSNVVELLLEMGANINAQAGVFGTALQAAAYGGHLGLVKFLLDAKADVKAQTESSTFRNALQAALGQPLITRVASSESHEQDILQLLLDRGAEVNALGGLYGDALQAAALNGKRNAVKLLLDRGANLTNRGGNTGSALEAAAYGGHGRVVTLLLLSTDRINAQRDVLESAMGIAIDYGHEEVKQMLQNAMKTGSNTRDYLLDRTSPRVANNQIEAMDKVVKWGVWTFKRLVKGGQKKQVDIIVRSIEKSFETAIQNRDRGLVQRISSAGAGALQAVIEIPDDRMVRRLTEIGLSVLQIAIREYNKEEDTKADAKVIMDNISQIWIVALELAIKGKQRSVVETVMNNTATQFKLVLDQADRKRADAETLPESMREAAKEEAEEKKRDAITLSQAAVRLFLAAVAREKQEMVECLANVVTKALDGALEGNIESRITLVKDLVTARATEFENALDEGRNNEAEALSKAGLATLLAAVQLGNQDLVKIISTIWAKVLHSALEKGHRNIVPALVLARASAFTKAVNDEREAEEKNLVKDQTEAAAKVKAVSEAVLAILMAAVESKCGELVDSMSGIWATVLHSASEGENMKRIEDLVTDRAKAFQIAIYKTRDDEGISNAGPLEVEALSEVAALLEVGLSIILASVETGHTALAEVVSRIWVDTLNLAIMGRRSKVMTILVEYMAVAFKTARDAGLRKMEAVSEVAVALLVAAVEARMAQLARILAGIWLSMINSVMDSKNIYLIEKIATDKAAEFTTAITKGFEAKADTLLSLGLEIIAASITHPSKSVRIVDLILKAWARALQRAVGQEYKIVEKLEKAVRRFEADIGNHALKAKVGFVLLLGAIEGSMKETMDNLFEVFGTSLNFADEGRYGGLVKMLVEANTKRFLSMQRGEDEEARIVIDNVMKGDYGVVAQRLVTEAVNKRGVPRPV